MTAVNVYLSGLDTPARVARHVCSPVEHSWVLRVVVIVFTVAVAVMMMMSHGIEILFPNDAHHACTWKLAVRMQIMVGLLSSNPERCTENLSKCIIEYPKILISFICIIMLN